ncbi:hypothetical protein C8R44DRAFT_888097 [Mycena epipterygia]|nr:hypothetical protein C8R44DRAFT_888097 [Mycena epipterygia]
MLFSHFQLAVARFFSLTATKPNSPIASLDYGTSQGAYDGNLTKFLGVPFSRPTCCPISTSIGPDAPEWPTSLIWASRNYTSISDACLTLDVFKPASARPDSKLPILVHNGFLAVASKLELPWTRICGISPIAELYPQDLAQGSSFGTGLANQVTPEFKRIAAFEGDFRFNGLRRLLVQHTEQAGKSTPELRVYHSSAFFPTNTKVPADNVAVDALINFLNTLDPNYSAALKSHYSNASVFWPTDPAVVNVTADDFRAEQIQFLLDLRVKGRVLWARFRA